MSWQEYLKKIEAFLDDLLVTKAPALSKNAKELLVTILPWLALVFGILGLMGGLSSLRFSALISPIFSYVGRSLSPLVFLSSLLGLVQSGLMLWGVPSLFAKAKKGWQLLFYSSLVGALAQVLVFSGFGIVLLLVSLYFLFQVKSSYR